MNNKRFACGLIFSTLLLTACVKKEAPTEDTNDSTSTDAPAVIIEPTETVEAPVEQNVQEPLIVETVDVEETPYTTTEVRRSAPSTDTPAATTVTHAAPATPAATSAPAVQLNNNSEEDAIAAAMAAAAPALDN